MAGSTTSCSTRRRTPTRRNGASRRADRGVLRRRGARRPADRTIFAVGDDEAGDLRLPGRRCRRLRRMGGEYRRRVLGAGRRFEKVELNISFRSTAPVLALVDCGLRRWRRRAPAWCPTAPRLQHLPTAPAMPGGSSSGRCCARPTSPKPPRLGGARRAGPGADAAAPLLAEAMAARIAAMIEHARNCRRAAGAMRPGDVLVLVRRRTAFVQRAGPRAEGTRRAGRRRRPHDAGRADRGAGPAGARATCCCCRRTTCTRGAAEVARWSGSTRRSCSTLAHGRAGLACGALMAQRGGEAAGAAAPTAIAGWRPRRPIGRAMRCLRRRAGGEEGGRRAAAGAARPRGRRPAGRVAERRARTTSAATPPACRASSHWLRRGGAEIKREAEGGAASRSAS